MNIDLSWDLFIVVFFVVIVAYSLIIGRDNTLKVILGTYVAALAADAIGNLFGSQLAGSEIFVQVLKMLHLGTETDAVVFVKVLAFVAMVILFAVKGAFYVETTEDRSGVVKAILSCLYAAMSAGLIISVILMFVSGISFVGISGSTGALFTEMYEESALVGSMVKNSFIWFAVPALSFLIHSFYSKKD